MIVWILGILVSKIWLVSLVNCPGFQLLGLKMGFKLSEVSELVGFSVHDLENGNYNSVAYW